ncbi:MAG: hypothetical protein P4L90_04665 [Rhodopila sp.]|nr:hypothetical protein [Rhodopila sp.]
MSEHKDNEPAKKEIKTDEIIDRLKPEPGIIKLAGRFLGHSDRAGYYRLYINERLDRYLEFPKEATLDAERFPSGRLVVWLKAGTTVTDTTSRTVPESLLSGPISRQNAKRAAGLAGMPRMVLDAASGDGCGGSSIANCPDTTLSFTCNPRDPSPDCPFNQ